MNMIVGFMNYLSFDVISCKNQLIRSKISFQCLPMIDEQYYHMKTLEEYIYLYA
jgi:hypothetical protein